jgi:hypothetical protein
MCLRALQEKGADVDRNCAFSEPNMKKLLIAFASSLMLMGCAAPPQEPTYYPPQASAEQMQLRAKVIQDLNNGKARLTQLQQSLGKVSSPVDGAAIRADIEAQQKQIDELETQLAGMPALDYRGYRPAGMATGSTAPCVISTCGPVNVRGYYRKDGTYVRPHTRSRGRR